MYFIISLMAEYTDKISWNLALPISKQNGLSPEQFAQSTIADLGLPIDMEPLLIYKIYEALYRHLTESIEDEVKHMTKLTINTALDVKPEDSSESTIPTANSTNKDKVQDKFNLITASKEFPKVKLCTQNDFMTMVSDTWKKVKPSYIEERVSVPYALLPDNKQSNIHAWK